MPPGALVPESWTVPRGCYRARLRSSEGLRWTSLRGRLRRRSRWSSDGPPPPVRHLGAPARPGGSPFAARGARPERGVRGRRRGGGRRGVSHRRLLHAPERLHVHVADRHGGHLARCQRHLARAAVRHEEQGRDRELQGRPVPAAPGVRLARLARRVRGRRRGGRGALDAGRRGIHDDGTQLAHHGRRLLGRRAGLRQGHRGAGRVDPHLQRGVRVRRAALQLDEIAAARVDAHLVGIRGLDVLAAALARARIVGLMPDVELLARLVTSHEYGRAPRHVALVMAEEDRVATRPHAPQVDGLRAVALQHADVERAAHRELERPRGDRHQHREHEECRGELAHRKPLPARPAPAPQEDGATTRRTRKPVPSEHRYGNPQT